MKSVVLRLFSWLVMLPLLSPGVSIMIFVASAIAANALFMQKGDHPAPFSGFTRVGVMSSVERARIEGIKRGSVSDATRWLNKNAPDPLIMVLQKQLAQKGLYKGGIDGLYGPETAKAVRSYETLVGNSDNVQDQIASKITARTTKKLPIPLTRPIAAKQNATNPTLGDAPDRNVDVVVATEPIVLAEPSKRKKVTRIQKMLEGLGFAPGKIDGASGPDTSAAIQRFEFQNNLPVTGEITDQLVKELVKASRSSSKDG